MLTFDYEEDDEFDNKQYFKILNKEVMEGLIKIVSSITFK